MAAIDVCASRKQNLQSAAIRDRLQITPTDWWRRLYHGIVSGKTSHKKSIKIFFFIQIVVVVANGGLLLTTDNTLLIILHYSNRM